MVQKTTVRYNVWIMLIYIYIYIYVYVYVYIYIYVAGDFRYLLIYLHGEVVKLPRNTVKVIVLINLRSRNMVTHRT